MVILCAPLVNPKDSRHYIRVVPERARRSALGSGAAPITYQVHPPQQPLVVASSARVARQVRFRQRPRRARTLLPATKATRDCCIEPEGIGGAEQSGGAPSYTAPKKHLNHSIMPMMGCV